MSSQRLIALKRKSAEIAEEARGVLAEIKNNTDAKKLDALEARHDELMRDFDQNRLDIEAEQLDIEEENQRAARRPNMEGTAWGGGEDDMDEMRLSCSSGWRTRDGKDVRVLERGDRWSKGETTGATFGDAVRAMVTGARTDSEKRALAEGTDSAGGYTVPIRLATEFIDRLRAQSAAIRAGARTVPMDSQTLSIARLDTDPTVTWRAENALIGDSDPTFSALTLEAKALAGIVKVSRELLADSVNVGEMLTNAFAQAMALEMDRVALWGDGTDDSPVGVAGTSGINEVSMGTNGAALSNYDKLIDAVYEMKLDNAADPTAMIMHPRTEVALAKFKSGDGNPIIVPEMIARIPRLATTAASIAETQGTATNASSILFGDFRHLFIGMREEVRITILRERYADYGQVGFLCWMRADVALAHKASFSRLKGIIPA